MASPRERVFSRAKFAYTVTIWNYLQWVQRLLKKNASLRH
jgi:hypothetical protein